MREKERERHRERERERESEREGPHGAHIFNRWVILPFKSFKFI